MFIIFDPPHGVCATGCRDKSWWRGYSPHPCRYTIVYPNG